MRKHTPGPWKLEPYDSCLAGEDFQWGGIWAGPVMLDGINYGQPAYATIKPETLERMEADARLIAAAPDLLSALDDLARYADTCELFLRETHPGKADMLRKRVTAAIDAMAKATGGEA